MNKQHFPELIADFARAADDEFSLAELTKYIRSEGIDAGEDEVEVFAAASDYLLESGSLKETYIPRQVFFRGAQFRITPLKEEVKGGYLLPGHRFMPFLSHELFPGSVQLRLPGGSVAAARKTAVPQAQAWAGLLFYGSHGTSEYLLFDDVKNAERLDPAGDADVLLTVFDLASFYAENNFQPGDSLMLTVDDWLLGRYSVECAGPAVDAAAARQWVSSLDSSLAEALDDFGVDGDCNFQLALALRTAQQDPDCISLMQEPPLSVAAGFNLLRNYAVKEVGARALFWDSDEDPLEEVLWDSLENPREPESELDAFFQELGLSLSEGEAEAYMRDALYQGKGGADSVLARITEGRSLFFSSAEEQERFHGLWNILWEEVRQDYAGGEDVFGELRSRFLGYNDKILGLLRQLDASGTGVKIFQNPAFMQLNELSGMVSSALELFNRTEEEVGKPSEFMSGGMMNQLDAAIDALTGQFGDGRAQPVPQYAGGTVYQLKVALKGGKPPIWRRILIPASMELAGLHDAIQGAMGWYNCHLHQFRKGRIYYSPEAEDGFLGFSSESYSGMQVADLLQREKDKIIYEYDFGDSWEHTVTLEKILEPEAGQSYPVCIKGKRACPPEDCGGLWGYYNLLEILDDPDHEEHEEMLEWVEEKIDPEAFDLDQANARIRQIFS